MSETTATPTKDDLIRDIGAMILSDSHYRDNPWQALSIVVTITDTSRSMTGYRYLADGSFSAALPDDDKRPMKEKLRDLRDVMATETGDTWHQCLIQIWQPGPEIRVQFEYDDPTRWDMKGASLDMSGYANSLKPEMG